MKKDLHPKYFEKAEAVCACGAKFYVGSTKEKLEVEVCSQCHPFYSGQEKIIDTAGRVQKFKERIKKASQRQSKKTTSKKSE
ncbi:MAG: 50S ribosomal protein L31 [Minisyncoccia bacterium]